MRKNLFRLALALCLSLPVVVQANPVFPATTSGNTTSYGEGTYSNATYAAAAVATTAAGAIAVEYRTQIATAAGAVFPIVTRALPSTAAIAGAARYCLANVACYGTAAAAAAIGVIASHYGYDYENTPTGPVITRNDPNSCTSYPCTQFAYAPDSRLPTPSWFTTTEKACKAFVSAWNAYGGLARREFYYVEGLTCMMRQDNGGWWGVAGNDLQRRTIESGTPSKLPATPAELASDIEASAKPDTAQSTDAKKTVLTESAKSGYEVPLSRPTSIDVPKPVVTQNPTHTDLGGGKTKTTTKRTSVTCTPPDCVAIETTIEQVKDLGVGTTTTTTTETPADVVQDVPLSDVPKLYKRKYESGIVGVWTEKKAQLSSSGLGSLLQAMMPNIGSSGGCPVFSIPAKIGPLSFGSGFSGPPCYIWEFCKVVVLLGAAFLARALVFGG
ncbi:hypothetical protein RAE19_05210 [Rhodoferax sp. TBRC 17660]|uniref:Uncharacterized protein n=1 Tax=Rhodoferax potami TaxID=3068338 RepID=A0ABU3KKS1_9BURK|nr:hypothetical protein [Rhodoferax sp. TBRC 17660]MDT7518136.1 hypothetical protein [Rhodoferax sp. TBRC 17660]